MTLTVMLLVAISISISVFAATNGYTNEQSGIDVNPYADNTFLLHSYPTRTVPEGTKISLIGYSLYDFPESRQLVIDFVSQFPTAIAMATPHRNPIINSWDGTNFYDNDGFVIPKTDLGVPVYFYLFNLTNGDVPEIIMLYANNYNDNYLNTVIYRFQDGEFRPMPANLHGISSSMAQPGEYNYVLPFTAFFYDRTVYFPQPLADLFMFTSSPKFDIAGEWYVKFYNGAIYFEPMRVIRASEGLG